MIEQPAPVVRASAAAVPTNTSNWSVSSEQTASTPEKGIGQPNESYDALHSTGSSACAEAGTFTQCSQQEPHDNAADQDVALKQMHAGYATIAPRLSPVIPTQANTTTSCATTTAEQPGEAKVAVAGAAAATASAPPTSERPLSTHVARRHLWSYIQQQEDPTVPGRAGPGQHHSEPNDMTHGDPTLQSASPRPHAACQSVQPRLHWSPTRSHYYDTKPVVVNASR